MPIIIIDRVRIPSDKDWKIGSNLTSIKEIRVPNPLGMKIEQNICPYCLALSKYILKKKLRNTDAFHLKLP